MNAELRLLAIIAKELELLRALEIELYKLGPSTVAHYPDLMKAVIAVMEWKCAMDQANPEKERFNA